MVFNLKNNADIDYTFLASAFDQMNEEIAIIRQNGEIIFVNKAWIKFGEDNNGPRDFKWIGINYLDACRPIANQTNDSITLKVRSELDKVLRLEKSEAQLDYPCNTPKTTRWFTMRIARINEVSPPTFILTHRDITEQKKNQDESRTDSLSGLANRRYFEALLEKEWNRARRSKSPLSCIVLDIDHFKLINDKYGHHVGDQCIAYVSEILSSFSRREGNVAARIGGEEFALIVSNLFEADVFNLAEIIRIKVNQLKISHISESITVSCGVACVYPTKELEPKKLISMADAAMYKAKRNGRNQSVLNNSADPFEMF